MILVVGATGTVGSEVLSQLIAGGERARALVRDREKASERLGEQVEFVVGDLDRPETLQGALAGVDRVFLLTRQTTRQLEQERAIIQAAVRAGVRHLVKLSVFRADERSPLQVARQHRQAEAALEDSSLACTILRPPFFMQNLLGMVRNGAIYTAAQDGRVAMIDARDIAAVAVTALTSPDYEGQTFTPTGPEAMTFDDVATIVSAQTGQQVKHVRVPPDAVRDSLQATGVQDWFAADMAKLHTMLATGYEDVVTDDFRTVTGHPPRTVAQFAADFAPRLSGQRQQR
jgi:uncharacterized protein YbjT (DUF2867 family)